MKIIENFIKNKKKYAYFFMPIIQYSFYLEQQKTKDFQSKDCDKSLIYYNHIFKNNI